MKWLLLVILSQPTHADALLDLMLQNSYIDELENDEPYAIDDFSEAEHLSWRLQESDDLIIIYDDRCNTWDK